MPKPSISKKRNPKILDSEDLNLQLVPSFILNLYNILSNSKNARLIHWSKDGTSFIVEDIVKFTSKILSNVFKHENYSSFVRQLNMYDFHKIKTNNHRKIFRNTYFQKDNPEQLTNIKRKVGLKTIENNPNPNPKNSNTPEIGQDINFSSKIDQLIQSNKEIEKKMESIIKTQEEFKNNQVKITQDMNKMNEKIIKLENISSCVSTFLPQTGSNQDSNKDVKKELSTSNFYQYNIEDLLKLKLKLKSMINGLPYDFPLFQSQNSNFSLPRGFSFNQVSPMIKNKRLLSFVPQAKPSITTPLEPNQDNNIRLMKEKDKKNQIKENNPSEVAINPFNISPAEISYLISPNINSSQVFPSPNLNVPFIGGESPYPHYFSSLNDYGRAEVQPISPKNCSNDQK